MADRVGQALGSYQLIQLLGRGGFAEVYLGEHLRLGTKAAIKVLSTQLSDEDEAVFQKEARTIAALEHPNIVRVLDFAVQDGTPFLVMSYAANGTLRARHPRGTRLSLEAILPYIKQVADALHYAHEEKLVHRDIKPENMLLGKRNEVLLSDFGIATVAQSSRYQGTQEVAGTVAYMAPEQVQDKPRPASDQYALGIVVYEWLSGERPFHGTFTEIAAKHVLASPPPLREKLPDLSPAVEQAVMIALEKDPKERFGSILAFATALEQAQQPCASIHFAQTQIIRPSSPLLDPTIAVTPANTPAAAYLPTVLPSKPAAPRPPTQSSRIIDKSLLIYRGHTESVRTLAWSPDGNRIASGSSDGAVQVWDAARGQTFFTRSAHQGEVRTISWSPDGRYLVTGSSDDTLVYIWDTAPGRVIFTYKNHTAPVGAVAWSPRGQWVASGSEEGVIHLWDALTGKKRFPSLNYRAGVYTVAWSHDGQRLAIGGRDGSVQIWDTEERRTSHYSGHSSVVWSVAWASDRQRIASASADKTVQIWQAVSRRLLISYPGSSASVGSVAWSPDSRYIASIGENGSVQVWNTTNSLPLFTYQGHQQPATAVAWSPTRNQIASAGKDKTVHIWSVE